MYEEIYIVIPPTLFTLVQKESEYLCADGRLEVGPQHRAEQKGRHSEEGESICCMVGATSLCEQVLDINKVDGNIVPERTANALRRRLGGT